MKQKNERQRVLHLTKKDFVFETFRAGGKGGQNQNKRDTGVRVKHPPSGAVGEARDSRTQGENRKKAFRRMADSKKFQDWVRLEHSRAIGQIESSVDAMMQPENLKIEYGPFE